MLKQDPLVSILIPAYNAQEWITESIQSAIAQTWPRKEIIVVDDGSRDRTAEIARSFAAQNVKVVSTENRGLSAAVNTAYRHCQGDYIQELDSDDLLSPNKIEVQLRALREGGSRRTLASSPWGYFYHRRSRARFVPNSLWHDLSPAEWLLRKMRDNNHMQNATWLVSRELAEAAGPWNEALRYDQDGEYFIRVLAASDGIRFVPEGRVFYRTGVSGRISFIGGSDEKRNSLLVSMKAHVRCLLSLEDSARTRSACITYLQNWSEHFYPDRPEILRELGLLAKQLGGHLGPPTLRWKYAWLRPVFGRALALRAQQFFPEFRVRIIGKWDKLFYGLEKLDARG